MSSLQEKLSHPTLPLWTLKLSRVEYEELKNLLRERIQKGGRSYPYRKEACLFFAEWWKREYSPILKEGRKGSVSKKDVFDSLGIEGDAEAFYRQACKGAESLGIEYISLEATDRPLYSMLYQGGLPMGNVCSSQTADGWDKFIRGLVLRDYDFRIIPNQSAEKSSSLIAFCDLIKQADDQDKPELMPFYCEDRDGLAWYRFIHEEIRKGKERLIEERPFDINWEFTIDHLGHALMLDYVIRGPQSLPRGFLDKIGNQASDSIEIEIMRNNLQVYSVHYHRNILGKRFLFRSPYINNDVISMGVKGWELILSDSLDLESPHIICKENNGRYQLGNKIGAADSYIVYSEEWEPEGEVTALPERYSYCNQTYRLIHIPLGEETDVTLKNIATGDTILFSPRIPLSWTEIYYPENELNYIFKEPVFDPASCLVYKKSDKGIEKCRSLLYRAVGAKEWREIPPIGGFFVRPNDSQYVSPARAVFLGLGYHPKVKPGREACSFDIAWSHGRARPFYGKDVDGTWMITKDDCQGKPIVPCTFTPQGNGRSFDLNLRLPFVDFRIYDFNMNPVCDRDTIPLSDISIYSYCFAKSDDRDELFRFSFSKTGEKYCAYCNGKKLSISGNGHSYEVPCEGSLESLLGGMEKVSGALGKDGTPLLITFSEFDFDPGLKYSVYIAWRPFEIEKISGHPILRINERNAKGRVTYEGKLRVFPLDGSMGEPFAIQREEDGTYLLPDSTPDTFLVAEDNQTSNNGKLRIRMHSLADVPDADRKRLAIQSLRGVYNDLLVASFDAKPWKEARYWFKQSLDYSLVPSKLHHLKLLGGNDNLLNFFCFHEYVLSDKPKTELIEDLLELEDGLSFNWWWFEKKKFAINPPKVMTESFPDILLNWSRKFSFENNDIEALMKTTDKDAFMDKFIIEFYEKMMNGFAIFKKELAIASKRKFCMTGLIGEHHDFWEKFIDSSIAALSDYASPEYPMLDYGSDLSEQHDRILFPEVKFPTKFGNYVNNASAFLKRVSRLADYMNGKETDVFFHGTEEDIVANPTVGLDRTMRVRNSIVYYLNKDKEIFINHLPFFAK